MESPSESYTSESIWLESNSTTSMSPPLSVRKPRIIAMTIAYTVVFLMITTNVISLITFTVEKKLRTYNNYYIINIVLSDLLTGIATIKLCIYVTYGYFPFSEGFCRFFKGISEGLLTVSNLGMVAICIDRYRATYDPIHHFTSRSKRRAVITNGMVWVISFGFWFSYATIWDFVVDFNNSRRCLSAYSHSAISTIVPIILSVFLPLSVSSILYFRIYTKINMSFGGRNVINKFKRNLERSNVTDSEGSTSKDQTDDSTSVGTVTSTVHELAQLEEVSNHNGKPTQMSVTTKVQNKTSTKITMRKSANRESTAEMRRATRTLLFIIVAFCVTWVPRSTLDVIYAVNPTLLYINGAPFSLFRYVGWFTYANSVLNPISYVASQPLFRETAIRILCHPCSMCRK